MRWKRLGAELTEARKQAGLTQEKLAHLLSDHLGAEISQQNIQQWCSGQYRPADRPTLVGLCCVLYREGGFQSLVEINAVLQAADQGALHAGEVRDWFESLSGELEGDLLSAAAVAEAKRAREHGEGASADTRANQLREPRQTSTTASFRMPLTVRFLAAGRTLVMLVVAAGLMGGGCVVASENPGPVGASLWVACLWSSTLLLAWRPDEAGVRSASSTGTVACLPGTAGGVLVTACFLAWMAALTNVFFEVNPPAWLVCGLSGLGAVIIYATGGFQPRWYQEEGSVQARTMFEVAAAMLIGQALLGWFLVAVPVGVADYLLIFVSVLLLPAIPYAQRVTQTRRSQGAEQRSKGHPFSSAVDGDTESSLLANHLNGHARLRRQFAVDEEPNHPHATFGARRLS